MATVLAGDIISMTLIKRAPNRRGVPYKAEGTVIASNKGQHLVEVINSQGSPLVYKIDEEWLAEYPMRDLLNKPNLKLSAISSEWLETILHENQSHPRTTARARQILREKRKRANQVRETRLPRIRWSELLTIENEDGFWFDEDGDTRWELASIGNKPAVLYAVATNRKYNGPRWSVISNVSGYSTPASRKRIMKKLEQFAQQVSSNFDIIFVRAENAQQVRLHFPENYFQDGYGRIHTAGDLVEYNGDIYRIKSINRNGDLTIEWGGYERTPPNWDIRPVKRYEQTSLCQKPYADETRVWAFVDIPVSGRITSVPVYGVVMSSAYTAHKIKLNERHVELFGIDSLTAWVECSNMWPASIPPYDYKVGEKITFKGEPAVIVEIDLIEGLTLPTVIRIRDIETRVKPHEWAYIRSEL